MDKEHGLFECTPMIQFDRKWHIGRGANVVECPFWHEMEHENWFTVGDKTPITTEC